MARGLKENVRIRQGTPIAAVSTSKARISGEALTAASAGLGNLGSALARAAKADTDKMTAILKTRDQTEASTTLSNALFNIRKRTGSGQEGTLQDQLIDEMSALKQKFNGYSGLRKENATNAFNAALGSGTQELQGTFLALRNASLHKELGTTVKSLQEMVYADPDKFTVALAKAFELTQSLADEFTVGGVNASEAFLDSLEEDFTQIALDSIIDSDHPDKFNKARAFINKSLARLSPKERDIETDKIDKLEVTEGTRDLKLLTNARKIDDEEKNIQKDARFEQDVKGLVNATTLDAKKQKLLSIRKAFVKGIYDKAEFEFFEDTAVNPISDVASLAAELEIETMISRGSPVSFIRKKLQLLAKNNDINGDPAIRLMAKLRTLKSTSRSKIATKVQKQADFIFRTQFAKNPLDVDSAFSENKDKGVALAVRAEALAIERGLEGRKKRDAIGAMNEAIRKIVGVNALTQQIIIPFVAPIDQADSKVRKETRIKIVKKYLKIPKKDLTKKEKQTFNDQMKGFKMNDLLDELQQGLNFDPKEGKK